MPGSAETIFNNGGTVTSLGYNLASEDGGGVLTGPGDQINTDPMLGPLQDNGGATFTHELLPRSPAIDARDPSFTPPPLSISGACVMIELMSVRLKSKWDLYRRLVQHRQLGQGATPAPRPHPIPGTETRDFAVTVL